MSHKLINHSPDLKRLRDEGYDVSVKSNYLVVRSVPYVAADLSTRLGTLVSELTLSGDVTARPSTHQVYFNGDYPRNQNGSEIDQIRHSSANQKLDVDLEVQHSFSSKPPEGYQNYYDKMTTYIAIISNPARAIDPTLTAKVFPVVVPDDDESVFNYIDTASSRADIVAVSRKLETKSIAIVGLGGTGSYILDLVAKTPVREIHLFDGDDFLQHNAFRSPGAASVADLGRHLRKVDFFQEKYSALHRHIIAHNVYVDESIVDQVAAVSFAFLCLDRGLEKRLIVEKLEQSGKPFIDVGMGVELVDERLGGVLRVTTSTNERRDHVRSKNRIPFTDGDGNADYARNIQIADLNALNAALAVIKWKKLCGFYRDLEGEHFSTYTTDGNCLINEDSRETSN